MTRITALTDPTKLPNPSQDQTTFDANFVYYFENLLLRAQQENALVDALSAIAGGSANKMVYRFATSTAMADPAPGYLRLNATAQSSATALALDLLGADGVDYTALIGTFVASSSLIRGNLRVEKLSDPTQFLLFNVTALATPTGYRQLTVACTQSNGPAFLADDLLLLSFARNGDKGEQGTNGFSNMVVLTTTQTWKPPAGVTKGEITVIDGGYSGGGNNQGDNTPATGGRGGHASVSIRALDPSVTYTATVGAGGVGASGSNPGLYGPTPGGLSSFSGAGLTTLTAANGDLKIPGGGPNQQFGGGSLYAGAQGWNVSNPGIGQGGLGVAGTPGGSGQPGAVIIRY